MILVVILTPLHIFLIIRNPHDRTDYVINREDKKITILIDMVLDTFRIRAY